MNRRRFIRASLSLSASYAVQKTHPSAFLSDAEQAAVETSIPPALSFRDGSLVRTSSDWSRRRTEILAFAREQMYGQTPQCVRIRFKVVEKNGSAFHGKAQRCQVRIWLTGHENGPHANFLLYLPSNASRVPAILSLNYYGNHTVCDDPEIVISEGQSFSNNRRGSDAKRWPIAQMLDKGYAFGTIGRQDIDPDESLNRSVEGLAGLRTAFPELQAGGDNFSAVSAWAWTLSRAMDYLEGNANIDTTRVAVFGGSRLGKAAVWAGAQDERFAAVISHESGTGGAKLFRCTDGENIQHLNTAFPYWFCQNFKAYNGMDTRVPFDQHLILASIAPRPLYVGSAIADPYSGPRGEFESAVLASDVYRFLGFDGLSATTFPEVGQAIPGRVSYHVRAGGHTVMDYDWQQYLSFLVKYL